MSATPNCMFQKYQDNLLVVFNSTADFKIADGVDAKVRLEENEWINLPVYLNNKTYFASVDLMGEAEIKIYDKEYKIKENSEFSLELEEGLVFKLFVNTLDKNVPAIDDDSVIYLIPGVNSYENCIHITENKDGGYELCLESNQTLYIAGNSVLNADIRIRRGSNNVKIFGRGIILNSDIIMSNSENVIIDGVILLGGSVKSEGMSKTTVNIKTIA